MKEKTIPKTWCFKIRFNGRLANAIGVTANIETTEEFDHYPNIDDIQGRLYDAGFEHITRISFSLHQTKQEQNP